MKYKVSELEGALLDAAVAKAEWGHCRIVSGDSIGPFGTPFAHRAFAPSTVWEHGGPIIEREQITVESPDNRAAREWRAVVPGTLLGRQEGGWDIGERTGPTPLIAAMRAYVASKFGDEVELP